MNIYELFKSFNPYSTGFSSFIQINQTLKSFFPKFQSLFYWILFFYIFKKSQKSLDILCFNPYSTGFSSFISKLKYNKKDGKKFQSLFYWILFFYWELWKLWIVHMQVSILILLDSLLLYRKRKKQICTNKRVSILILLNSLLLCRICWQRKQRKW